MIEQLRSHAATLERSAQRAKEDGQPERAAALAAEAAEARKQLAALEAKDAKK